MQTIIFNKKQFANIANECLNNLKPNTQYNFCLEEASKPKTLKQLNFLFGAIISSLQKYYFETDGINYRKDLLKELLYDAVGIDETLFLPTGKEISYRKSLSKMTKDEASEFINRCIGWIDENTDVRLSPAIRFLWTANISDNEVERLLSYKFNEVDSVYLSHLRKGFCLNCGARATEVHHLRQGAYSVGKKNPDYLTISICADCHRKLHDTGEKIFLKNIEQTVLNNMPIELFCKLLYQKIRNGL